MNTTCIECLKVNVPKVPDVQPDPRSPTKDPIADTPSAKKLRLPRGWKDFGKGPICKECVKKSWFVKTITLPVHRILGRWTEETYEDGKKTKTRDVLVPVKGNSFLRHFLPAWRMSTDLSNWAKQQLLRHDVRRLPGMKTLPKFVPMSLYKQWNDAGLFPAELRSVWAGCSGTASALLKFVEDTWKGHKSFGRFAVIWKNDASAGTCRFPQPWVVRSQECNVGNGRIAYDIRTGQDGQVMKIPIVTINLPAGDDTEAETKGIGGRYVLELSTHPDFRRMLNDFAKFIPEDGEEAEAVSLDVKLIGKMRDGRLIGAKIAISGRFPRTSGGDPATRIAKVSTCDNAMMSVQVPDSVPPWVLHAKHLYGPLSAYTRWSKRLEDATQGKPEDHPPSPVMPSKPEIQRRLDALATKVRLMRHGHIAPQPSTNALEELQKEAAQYEAWLERYRTDLKFEKRWPANKRKNFVLKAQARIEKHNNRIQSEIKQIAAAAVGFVQRQRCGMLEGKSPKKGCREPTRLVRWEGSRHAVDFPQRFQLFWRGSMGGGS